MRATNARYVWADLIRNPRRTLSTMAGVTLGVGLSCAVLFFVDGLSASMTQRAVAPLPIDMQQVLTQPIGGDLELTQTTGARATLAAGDATSVHLSVRNLGDVPASEVVVRSAPRSDLEFVVGSATVDGSPVDDGGENPFARGAGGTGANLGTIDAGGEVTIAYDVRATSDTEVSGDAAASSYSSREVLTPVAADSTGPADLEDLATRIRELPGVDFAEPLSFVGLGSGSLSAGPRVASGPGRVFGFDRGYTERDETISLVDGSQEPGDALISAEAAGALGVTVGDPVSIALPDASTLELTVSGIVDLTRARSLFSSRQGEDLETFLYVPSSMVVDQATFAESVLPAFERATTERGGQIKSPPVNEVDVGVRRELLDADPGTALGQTEEIAASVSALGGSQDYLLDNISNTLSVARDDAAVAKRLFVFLGVPGAVLAAILAAYAGSVLAGAQRREQATLRIRGASRRDLLSMLAVRVTAITLMGSLIGVTLGWWSAALVIGQDTLLRANTASLVVSGLLGALIGLAATGAALYVTGRRSITRQINDDRARMQERPPVWRRYWLDVAGASVVLVATVAAVRSAAFDGTAGSIYVGRSVELPLHLLLLPVGAWIAGSLLAGRVMARVLSSRVRGREVSLDRPFPMLFRLSLRRRSWAVAEAAVVVALIVALGVSLSVFTASYDTAKESDARFALGSDLRIASNPADESPLVGGDVPRLEDSGVDRASPVVFGVHNSIVRSARTSEVASLAALDPASYLAVAPAQDAHFPEGGAEEVLHRVADDREAVLLSGEMADFLQAQVGDTLPVLLARGTDQQVETDLVFAGVFERLPGFPDGVDAVMHLDQHVAVAPATVPDYFLARSDAGSDEELETTVAALHARVGDEDPLQIDTRSTVLAKDQSSLAALNIRGLLDLDSGYALAMGTVTIAIFVFGLLLSRRREYVTLKAQGLGAGSIRGLIAAESLTVAVLGCAGGLLVGLVMAFYLVNVLRPLFILEPVVSVAVGSALAGLVVVVLAAALTSLAASSLVNRLHATELLRDE